MILCNLYYKHIKDCIVKKNPATFAYIYIIKVKSLHFLQSKGFESLKNFMTFVVLLVENNVI